MGEGEPLPNGVSKLPRTMYDLIKDYTAKAHKNTKIMLFIFILLLFHNSYGKICDSINIEDVSKWANNLSALKLQDSERSRYVFKYYTGCGYQICTKLYYKYKYNLEKYVTFFIVRPQI